MTGLTGTTVRGYHIGERIGSGGYGEVYRATQLSVNRDVAVKIILPQYANDPSFVADFEAEAKLVAQLEHINIVPLHDYWQDDSGAYLVMRFIQGGSLRTMLTKQGALPMTRTLRLVEQIADALSAAHEAGVVHRDLKPDNILIDQRGNAYLTDFGIAKRLEDENASATDAIKGTFAYLSPEQIQQADVSPATDIYALGVVLYEMLAGQHPFQETPVAMMVMKHLQETLPDIRGVRDDADADLDDIIQRATAKDPAERYATTLELVHDLRAAISGAVAVVPQAVSAARKKPTTTAERNRQAMLENVRKFWVEGVLENSLHEAAMIDLGLTANRGAVDNPWDTLIRTPSGEDTLTDQSILDVFDRMNGKLLILGDPGSGKTTTLLTLARDLLSRAETDEQHPIPVVLNLSSWSEKQPALMDWLIEELNIKYQVPRKVGTQWVEEDELLLLLDGLDEVAEDVRDACVNAINIYRSEHGFVDVVVCSRIKDYEALTGQLRLNGAIVIQPLDEDQIVQYLDGLGANVAVVRELIERDAQLRELATTPLMLSIMVLAYRGKSAGDVPDFDDLDAQRQHLFEVYVQRMFERRVGEKLYPDDRIRHYLTRLAQQLQAHAKSILYIEEMQPDWLQNPAHRRRYVNAIGISIALMSGLAISLVFVPMLLVAASQLSRYGVENRLSLPIYVGLTLILSVLLSVPTSWINYREAQKSPIVPVESVSWTFTAMTRNVWTKLPQAIMLGLGYAVISIVWLGFIFEVRIGVAVGAAIFVAQVVQYIHSSGFTTSGVDTKVRPNQGMWQSMQNTLQPALLGPLFFGVPIVLSITIAYDLQFGLVLAACLFFPLTLINVVPDQTISPGMFALLQHVTLRYLLERERQIPRNLAQMLDYAASLILLRKVGGGYIYIHRYLLEYFAELEAR
jgi:serine/threonine protein kinase